MTPPSLKERVGFCVGLLALTIIFVCVLIGLLVMR
jgi:hypothetical protein